VVHTHRTLLVEAGLAANPVRLSAADRIACVPSLSWLATIWKRLLDQNLLPLLVQSLGLQAVDDDVVWDAEHRFVIDSKDANFHPLGSASKVVARGKQSLTM
jgi:hypothetical protein